MDQDTLERAGLLYDVTGAVATITLNRPHARNAQTPTMWHALAAIGDELATDIVRKIQQHGRPEGRPEMSP